MKKANRTIQWAFVAFLMTIQACVAGTLMPLQGKAGHHPGVAEAAVSPIDKTVEIKG